MVKVTVDWEKRELTAEGHAGAEKAEGLDPVCLAVSVTLFALEDELKIQELVGRLKALDIEKPEKGRYRIRVEPKSGAEETADSILMFAARAIKILSTEYPENVQLETKNIRLVYCEPGDGKGEE